MPLPQKKKVKTEEENERKEEEMEQEQNLDGSSSEDDDDYDDSDEDSNEDADFDPNEEIMIDFEARAPDQYDLEPVKVLLSQKLAPFPSINVNDLAKIIVEQENIGNVIYQAFNDQDEEEEESNKKDAKETDDNNNDEDTIFGVLSLVDLNSSKYSQFSSNLKTFLLNECEKFDKSNKNNNKLKDKLNGLLKNNQVSYIINERYINVPAGISVPMYESLLKDLNKAKENDQAAKVDDDSGYWLFLIKMFLETTTAKSSKKATTEKVYSNPEEETFEEFAELKFDLSTDSKAAKNGTGGWSSTDESLRPVLSCMLVPKNKVNDALAKIKSLIK